MSNQYLSPRPSGAGRSDITRIFKKRLDYAPVLRENHLISLKVAGRREGVFPVVVP
jgi:hypothetical protein